MITCKKPFDFNYLFFCYFIGIRYFVNQKIAKQLSMKGGKPTFSTQIPTLANRGAFDLLLLSCVQRETFNFHSERSTQKNVCN